MIKITCNEAERKLIELMFKRYLCNDCRYKDENCNLHNCKYNDFMQNIKFDINSKPTNLTKKKPNFLKRIMRR